MICPNCGRELAEGEVCVCQQGNAQGASYEQPANNFNPYTGESVNNQGNFDPYTGAPINNQPQGGYDPNTGAPMGGGYYPGNPPQQPVYPTEVPARTDYPEGYKVKKKYVAVLLAFFLGVLGINNFYLGDSTKGIVKILLTTVGAVFVGLGPIASSIWTVVEVVQLLTEKIDRDSEGYKIQTYEDVLEKYCSNKD